MYNGMTRRGSASRFDRIPPPCLLSEQRNPITSRFAKSSNMSVNGTGGFLEIHLIELLCILFLVRKEFAI
jgi:hypothetical protein